MVAVFDGSLYRTMKHALDRANLEKVTCFSESVYPPWGYVRDVYGFYLGSGGTQTFPILETAEERFERSSSRFPSQEHVLQDLGMDLLILLSQLGFDGWQVALLLKIGDTASSGLIGVSPFGQRRVIQFPAPGKRPEEYLLLFACRIQSVFIGFTHLDILDEPVNIRSGLYPTQRIVVSRSSIQSTRALRRRFGQKTI